MQTEITRSGALLNPQGSLAQVGWARQPLLDCNLEKASFYPQPLRFLQKLRTKRWDYYAIFTPRRFFSATVAHLGYAGNIFVYTLDYETGELHEEGLVIPLGLGITLPRNSQKGQTVYEGKGVRLVFNARPRFRQLSVSWPSFQDGRGLEAELSLACPPEHESMAIVIPIEKRRFYYNRKINCLPAEGALQIGDQREELSPRTALGSLDWGRGVWAYRSFWNWASASGFLSSGETLGLNLGGGFGDLSAATENCLVLNGRVHKLGEVKIEYDPADYHRPWKFCDTEGRLELEFTPFKERVARTNLGVIFSEVHQMFGRYNGLAVTDQGKALIIENLTGFAEEHRARW